jgi:hypothetical protein
MPNLCTEGQPFSANYNPSYKAGGLAGHTGIDYACGYGTPIHSLYDGLVTLVWTPQAPASDGYTAVAILVDDGKECFEWQVGHCNPDRSILEGTRIKKGDYIGTEANHGVVYSGNVLITLAQQKAGNQAGHHRHYQKRPVMPVLPSDGFLLSNGRGGQVRAADGSYYQIFNFNGGYNGCVDPMVPVFNRLLCVGNTGYDCFVLQRILANKGFLTATPNGTFGPKTWAALRQWQISLGITPTGILGPLTRAQALRELAPLPVLQNQ